MTSRMMKVAAELKAMGDEADEVARLCGRESLDAGEVTMVLYALERDIATAEQFADVWGVDVALFARWKEAHQAVIDALIPTIF